MENVLAYVKTVVTSTWVGLFFNLAAIGSLWLSLKTYANTKDAEETAKELNRKAQRLYRGPVLLAQLDDAQSNLNDELALSQPDIRKLSALMKRVGALVMSVDEKLGAPTGSGKKILDLTVNSTRVTNVKRNAEQMYIALVGFTTSLEDKIEEQKASLI